MLAALTLVAGIERSEMSTTSCTDSENGVQPTGVPAAFRANRLPLTSRNSNTPYVRPISANRGPARPGSNIPGSAISGSGATSMTSGRVSARPISDAQATQQICQQVLDEVRRGRDDQKKIRDDLKRMAQQVEKLEEEYKKLNEQLKEQTDAAFVVESSVHKVRQHSTVTR